MKIIFLEPDVSRHDFYRNILTEIADKKDIKFFATGEDLSDFFENTLPSTQEHIDLLISEFILPDKSFKDINEAIKRSTQTYSHHNFKLSALPILLHTYHNTQVDFEKLEVDLKIIKLQNANDIRLSPAIKSLIKSWRLKIWVVFLNV